MIRTLKSFLGKSAFNLNLKQVKMKQHLNIPRYARIKHSDWLKIVMELGTTNQSS